MRRWVGPLIFAAAVAAAMFLSGLHSETTPNGLHLIRSGDEYQSVLRQADDIAKDRLVKVDKGEKLSNDDLNQLKKAQTLYDELSVFMPEKMGPYFGSGRIHLIFNETQAAEQDFRQAILVSSLNQDTRLADAIRLLTAESHYFLAQCYELDNQMSYALEDINEAIAIDKNQTNYYYIRARAELQLGQAKQADADLDKALDLNPFNRPAMELLTLRRAGSAPKKKA